MSTNKLNQGFELKSGVSVVNDNFLFLNVCTRPQFHTFYSFQCLYHVSYSFLAARESCIQAIGGIKVILRIKIFLAMGKGNVSASGERHCMGIRQIKY